MNTVRDYAALAHISDHRRIRSYVAEAYEGTKIVGWYGNIERQVEKMLDEQEAARNYQYSDKLRNFLKIWRSNEITGSLNRETLDVLKTASDMLSVDDWQLQNYFSTLRDQLRKLIASEEQMPRGIDMDQNSDFLGAGPLAGAGSMPPAKPAFGPDEKPPAELKGEAPVPNQGEEDPLQAQKRRAGGATMMQHMR